MLSYGIPYPASSTLNLAEALAARTVADTSLTESYRRSVKGDHIRSNIYIYICILL